MHDADIEKLNARISSTFSKGGSGVTLCLAGETGSTVTVEPVEVDNQTQLNLVVRDSSGSQTSPLPRGGSAQLHTYRTPISTVRSAFDVDPSRFRAVDGQTQMQPSSAIFLGPAGDPDLWQTRMNLIGSGLGLSYAKAILDHGTLIPGDGTSSRVQKQAKAVKKDVASDPSRSFEEAFLEMFADNFLNAAGSPHMPHAAKMLTGETDTVQFRANIIKKRDANVETQYDSLVPDAVLTSMKDRYGPGQLGLVPLYYNNRLVPPDEYVSVASRLRGSLVYACVWARVISNYKNKVQSVKFGLEKLVIAELGPEMGSGASGVVDLSSPSPSKRPASGAAAAYGGDDDGVVDVLAIASEAGKKRARVD